MQPLNLEFINAFFSTDANGFPVPSVAGHLLKSVQLIYDRDKKHKLNGEGAKKQLAFAYLWITHTFSNYSEKDREKLIMQRIGVDDNWKLWVETVDLIRDMMIDKKSITFKLLEGLEKTLHQWVDMLELIRENNERVNAFLKKPLDKLTVEELAQREVLLSQANDSFGDIVDMYNKLGNVITGVEKYQDKLISEEKRDSKKREDRLQLDHDIYKRKNIE